MKKEFKNTNLINYLGKSPEIKILDFLIENKRTSWNITEIENQGAIARSTLKLTIPKLIKLNLVKIERKIGNSTLYIINDDNQIIKQLNKISDLIEQIEIRKYKMIKKLH